MSHHCSTLIVHCIDFRFVRELQDFIAQEGHTGDCDVVSLAGSVKNLVHPINDHFKEVFLKQVELSKQLHAVSHVYLVNHMDCGAYGGHAAFASLDDEKQAHISDLTLAAQELAELYSDLTITKVLANISDSDEVGLEKV